MPSSVVKGVAHQAVESIMIQSASVSSFWAAGTLMLALVVSPWPICGQVPGATTNKFNGRTIKQWIYNR